MWRQLSVCETHLVEQQGREARCLASAGRPGEGGAGSRAGDPECGEPCAGVGGACSVLARGAFEAEMGPLRPVDKQPACGPGAGRELVAAEN